VPARLLITLLVITALLFTGCGDDKKDSSDSGSDAKPPSGPAATGDSVSGTAFTLNLAPGWRDATEEADGGAFNFDLVLVKPGKQFSTNINILRENPSGDVDVDDLREQYRGQRDSVGATGVTDSTPVSLDGDDAITYKYVKKTPGGDEVRGRQVLVVHDDFVLTITMTAITSEFAGANDDFDSMLASWRWN